MTLYGFKPAFQSLLRPLAARLARSGVTANRVTVLAAAGSIAVGLLVAALARTPAVLLLVPAWLVVRMALNAIDGLIAREHGQRTALGAFLNELGDAVSDVALYLPIAVVAPRAAFAVVLVACLSVIVELAGVIGMPMGASRRYDGPMGKSDRAAALGLLALLLGAGFVRADWLLWPMLAIAAALVCTVARRVRRALGEIAAYRESVGPFSSN